MRPTMERRYLVIMRYVMEDRVVVEADNRKEAAELASGLGPDTSDVLYHYKPIVRRAKIGDRA